MKKFVNDPGFLPAEAKSVQGVQFLHFGAHSYFFLFFFNETYFFPKIYCSKGKVRQS